MFGKFMVLVTEQVALIMNMDRAIKVAMVEEQALLVMM